MYVLGLSGHHDTAAALVRDGTMVAFAEQERFSRIKHDASFPAQAIQYCLDQAGITLGEVDHVAYFWQGPAQLRQALRHFVRYFPDTLDAFRNTKGDQGGRARGVIRTIREGGGGVEAMTVGNDGFTPIVAFPRCGVDGLDGVRPDYRRGPPTFHRERVYWTDGVAGITSGHLLSSS